MQLDNQTLVSLRTGFQTLYQQGFDAAVARSQYERIATYVPSNDLRETYGWLKDDAKMREWLGPRMVKSLSENAYWVPNRSFEYTIGVSSKAIQFDKIGTYAPRFSMMGNAAARWPNELVFGALLAGFNSPCHDGQNFFDTDHPVGDGKGGMSTYANTDGGAGPAWFLMDVSKPIMPLVFQEAIKPRFVAKDKVTDSNVFSLDEFQYGVDAFGNGGYGLPQLCWGSRQPLTPESYAAARAAMGSFRNDAGTPLGITPNLLIVPPALESAGRKIVLSENTAQGATNEWEGTAEFMLCPWIVE